MRVKNLKLIARTEEDLRVVSAHLQDSIANVSDIANLKKNDLIDFEISENGFGNICCSESFVNEVFTMVSSDHSFCGQSSPSCEVL